MKTEETGAGAKYEEKQSSDSTLAKMPLGQVMADIIVKSYKAGSYSKYGSMLEKVKQKAAPPSAVNRGGPVAPGVPGADPNEIAKQLLASRNPGAVAAVPTSALPGQGLGMLQGAKAAGETLQERHSNKPRRVLAVVNTWGISVSRFSTLLLLFLVACSACNKTSEQQVVTDKPDMAQVRRAFRDNYAATDNLEEKRRLANELIDQYAPELKPSFANFTGEGWDGALQAEDFQKMLSNCVTNNPQRQGYIFEVQAARDIAASGLQELVCNESLPLNGKNVNLDILATDRSTGKKYNFETKDWKKTSFTEEKVPDLIDQLERQKAALPDAVHVFFFNKAEREIPSGVRQQIEDAGFTIIARNNNPKRATVLLKQLRAGN